MKDEVKDYCNLCDQEKDCTYEYNDEYICMDCYTGLADRAEAQWESLQETLGGGN